MPGKYVAKEDAQGVPRHAVPNTSKRRPGGHNVLIVKGPEQWNTIRGTYVMRKHVDGKVGAVQNRRAYTHSPTVSSQTATQHPDGYPEQQHGAERMAGQLMVAIDIAHHKAGQKVQVGSAGGEGGEGEPTPMWVAAWEAETYTGPYQNVSERTRQDRSFLYRVWMY